MKRRKKHLVYVHQRIFLDTVFARYKNASIPPALLFVVLRCDPTIPEIEKATDFVIPIRSPMPHRDYWYLLYLKASKRSSILSYNSFRWTQWAIGMLGYLFPLCRSTAFKLGRVWYKVYQVSYERTPVWETGKPRKVNKPKIFMQLYSLFSILKNEVKSLFHVLKLVILTSVLTKFFCLSWDARSFLQIFLHDQVGLITTCSWVNREVVFRKDRLGSIFSWRHFFIWWRKNILIYWGCRDKEIIWMRNRSHSLGKIRIFYHFSRRSNKISYTC